MIRCQNLTISFNRHPVVHHLNCEFVAGSLTAVVGPNGAGKSSLLKAIAGLINDFQGQVHLTKEAKQRIAYLPQGFKLDENVPMTVFSVVAAGAWHKIGAFGRVDTRLKHQILTAIDQVGLSGFEQRSVHTLSGGQLQRALFARLMMQDAFCILLDEPFSAVDEKTQEDLLAIIHHWHNEGRTVLVVLHNYALVKQSFPNTLLIARDLIAHGETAAVLTADNMSQAAQLREAFDEFAEECHLDTHSDMHVDSGVS